MKKDAGSLSGLLLAWYDQKGRSLPWREDPTPYHVWISEIMLQQTRVEAVKGYYARFLERFPDIRALAQAGEDECLKLWEGLGYYSRARNLQKAARQILSAYGGRMPQTAKELGKLPGIGPYTSAAIASIAFGERIPAVDGNLLRVFARLALYEEQIRTPFAAAAARDFFLEIMPEDRPGDFNQALMDLGSGVCTPGEPACDCPLRPVCLAFLEKRTADFPVMPAKKPRSVEKRTVLVIRRDDRVLLRKRPSRGLLAGLYEFPNTEGWLSRDEAIEKARSLGCDPLQLRPLLQAKHVFTHKEWHMQGYEIRAGSPFPSSAPVKEGGAGFPERQEKTEEGPEASKRGQGFFASVRQLKEKYALPGAFAAYAQFLTEDGGTNDFIGPYDHG